MSTIHLIDPLKDPRWDRFVEAHPFGWVCHLSGWKKVIEESFRHMTGYYFVLLDPSGKNIQAGLPIYHVRSWILGDRLVSVPFATLCDPLVSSREDAEKLLGAASDLFKELKASYIELRTLHAVEFLRDEGFKEVDYFKHHYLPLTKEPDELKRTFHNSSVRGKINKAYRNKLKVKIGLDRRDLETFYKLHLMTRKRLGLPLHPYKLFDNLWRIFQPTDNISLLLATHEDKVIAGLILFKYRQRVSVEYICYDDDFTKTASSPFLYWESIRLAYEEGYNIFDFGRTSPANKGLMDFKGHWGTKVIDLPHFYYPPGSGDGVISSETSWKYKLVSKACISTPDFLQKMIGGLCYRHLG